MSNAVSAISNQQWLRLLSLSRNFQRIGDWLLDRRSALGWNVEASFWVLGLIISLCLLTLAHRVRRMEVVA